MKYFPLVGSKRTRSGRICEAVRISQEMYANSSIGSGGWRGTSGWNAISLQSMKQFDSDTVSPLVGWMAEVVCEAGSLSRTLGSWVQGRLRRGGLSSPSRASILMKG